MTESTIDYFKLARAQAHYRTLGYKDVETPWLVSQYAVNATLPVGTPPLAVDSECLVGSGEQGFIQMMLDGTLLPGRYQTTTPCFRNETAYDAMTRRTFMKTELIWYMPEDHRAAYEMVLNHAMNCFFEVSDVEFFRTIETPEGHDIMYGEIELGSYGLRRMDDHLWMYGTGLAEPRFSLAMRTALKVEDDVLATENDTSEIISDPEVSHLQ